MCPAGRRLAPDRDGRRPCRRTSGSASSGPRQHQLSRPCRARSTTADGEGALKSTAVYPSRSQMADAIVFSPFCVPALEHVDDNFRVRRRVRERCRFVPRELAVQVLDAAPRVLRIRPGAARWRPELPSRAPTVAERSRRPYRAARGRRASARPPQTNSIRAAAAKLLPRRNRDDADRAGPRDVRAAARRQVVALDVDQAQRALAPGLLAQRQLRRFRRVGEPDRDRAVFPDDAVGVCLGARDLRRRSPRAPDRSSPTSSPGGSSRSGP